MCRASKFKNHLQFAQFYFQFNRLDLPENRKYRLLKMSSSTTSINDLPTELICELFKYFTLKDLTACSMVSKRWHAIYSILKLDSLFAIDDDFYHRNDLSSFEHFYHSNRAVGKEKRCRLKIVHRLVDKPLLSNLKHLALLGEHLRVDLGKLLSKFNQLVNLLVRVKYIKERNLKEKNVDLKFSKLQALVYYQPNVYGSFALPFCLSIDCPKLNTLVFFEDCFYGYHYNSDVRLKLKHPETVRELETSMYSDKALAPFKNVECLVTDEFEVIDKATLQILPKLKELRYNQNIEKLFTQYLNQDGTFRHIKLSLTEFMEDVQELRGPDFRFRFVGFLLTKAVLNQIDFGVRAKRDFAKGEYVHNERVYNEYVYVRNHRLIDADATLEFVRILHYNDLFSNGAAAVPMGFFQKFTGLMEVHATGNVQDADHFAGFLKSLRSLRRLRVDRTGLSKEWYDQIAAALPSPLSVEFV